MGFYYRFKKLLFNNISFFMIIFNVVKSKECSFLPFDCVLCQECVFLLRYHRAYAHLCLDFVCVDSVQRESVSNKLNW